MIGRKRVDSQLEQRWLEENKAAFAAYNMSVAKHGLLSDDLGLLGMPTAPESEDTALESGFARCARAPK
jgi:hypothetical protein